MAKYKIQKTKKGLYTCVVYLGKDAEGKKIQRRITGTSSAQVRMEADQMRDERHRTAYCPARFRKAAADFADQQHPMVSESTYRDYQTYQRGLESRCSDFMALRIDQIDKTAVQRVLGALKRSGLSAKSVRNYWGFINQVLKSQGLKLEGITLPEKTVPEIFVPDDTMIRKMMQLLDGDPLEIPVMLAAFGPMRMGEIIALDMSDIDGNVVHVHKDVAYLDGGGSVIKERPKTAASNRYIEYPAEVIDKIRKQGFVTHYNTKMMGYYFNKFLAENGFPHFRFHDLRHYAASTLHAQGVPDAYIMQRGGWTTDRVLKAVYRHTLADQERVNIDRANTHFSSIMIQK